MEDMKQNKNDDFSQEAWLKLCEYVKIEILEMPEKNKFPKALALRLRGLSEGKFMANRNIKAQASYSYKTILLTFMFFKKQILYGLHRKDRAITKESHKINYAMVVVENNINDIVDKLRRSEKANNKISNLTINTADVQVKYTSKTKKTKNKNLQNLW